MSTTAQHEDEQIGKDETITIRPGDRFRFEDESGCELAMVGVGASEDAHAIAIYTYGVKGKTLGYTAVFK